MPILHAAVRTSATTFLRCLAAGLSLAVVTACGGGGGGSSTPSPPPPSATLKSIAISPTSSNQVRGHAFQYAATGTYSDGSTRDVSATVSWNTTDSSIATISATGLAAPLQVGTTTIVASSDNVLGYATMHVTVKQATETLLYRFTSYANDGSQPSGPLVQGRDGNFYGVTAAGGGHACFSTPDFCGTVFKLGPDGAETILHAFAGAPSDGWSPQGALLLASDGNFYGTTSSGGTFDKGTVFRISPAGDYAVLYSFGATPADGVTPTGDLIQTSDGNLYGTTASGGTNSCAGVPNLCGTAYRITLTGNETVIYTFGATITDGWQPNGLIQGPDGNFYGTADIGGVNSCAGYDNLCGTVFKLSPDGVETTLYSFGASLADGAAPQGPLILGADGNFYGVTGSGGGYVSSGNAHCYSLVGCGTVFRVTPAGVETVLYAFGSQADDGNGPTPYLTLARDGNFYGTTNAGGINDVGAVFQVTPAGGESIIYSFGANNTDARGPVSLMQASDGNFYGLTQFTMGSAMGAFFRIVP
jgi:uncharacterized repeat protein (TIGR03803 family)